MQEKRSINLCSTYMLPLVGLNQSSFGIGNFMNSYVAEDNTHIVVELKQLLPIIKSNSAYRFSFIRDGANYHVFELPLHFRSTVELFRKGKYSEFPDNAKDTIRKKSGLRYKVPTGDGKTRTARELLALDRDSDLRKLMEDELGVKISRDAELASIPGEENFFELHATTTLAH